MVKSKSDKHFIKMPNLTNKKALVHSRRELES